MTPRITTAVALETAGSHRRDVESGSWGRRLGRDLTR